MTHYDDVCTCGHPKAHHRDHPSRRCRMCETCPSYEVADDAEPTGLAWTDEAAHYPPLPRNYADVKVNISGPDTRNTRRDNPSHLCACGCKCPCGCWTCADGYHCAGDDCPHADGRGRRHHCPDCGAFCKPIWLPYPALGTDPNWRCNNCGSRT